MSAVLARWYPQAFAVALCVGLAGANVTRAASTWTVLAAVGSALAAACVAGGHERVVLICLGLLLAGWWWGSMRLDRLDTSPLSRFIGHSGWSTLVVTAPARRGSYALRIPARVRRFDSLKIEEPVLVELPLGRAPPQGAILETVVQLSPPRTGGDGFDERAWLRRQGVHVVARARDWRIVGRRGGLGGYADRVHAWLGRSLALGVHGERRAVLEGIILGEDQGLSDELRTSFRVSGLYHLLAVSGQNVAFVAGGVLLLAWLLGMPRWLGEIGALAAIGSYVLAVGPQPSVLRAGIAGALASLAWLTSRPRDRWHFLALGAAALLIWNPYSVLDPGFQLSFAAVAAIFVASNRLEQRLSGYPLPRKVAAAVAISIACGAATAPILWLQFGRIPVYSVLSNALAEPVVMSLLGLGFAAAIVAPLSTTAAAAIDWANGWLAAYLVACARLVADLPFATVSSGTGVLALVAVGVYAAVLVRARGRDRPDLLALGAIAATAAMLWRS